MKGRLSKQAPQGSPNPAAPQEGISFNAMTAYPTQQAPLQLKPSETAQQIFKQQSGKELTWDNLKAIIIGTGPDNDLADVKTLFNAATPYELTALFNAAPDSIQSTMEFQQKLFIATAAENTITQDLGTFGSKDLARTKSGYIDASDPTARMHFAAVHSGLVKHAGTDPFTDKEFKVNGMGFQMANATGFYVLPGPSASAKTYKEPPSDYVQLIQYLKTHYADLVSTIKASTLTVKLTNDPDIDIARMMLEWQSQSHADFKITPAVAGLNKWVAITAAETMRNPLYMQMLIPLITGIAEGTVKLSLEKAYEKVWGAGSGQAQILKHPMDPANLSHFQSHTQLTAPALPSMGANSQPAPSIPANAANANPAPKFLPTYADLSTRFPKAAVDMSKLKTLSEDEMKAIAQKKFQDDQAAIVKEWIQIQTEYLAYFSKINPLQQGNFYIFDSLVTMNQLKEEAKQLYSRLEYLASHITDWNEARQIHWTAKQIEDSVQGFQYKRVERNRK